MTEQEKNNLKEWISELSDDDSLERDLYLRKLANGEMQGPPVGYASIDKPWLKEYSEEAIKIDIPNISAYDYLLIQNEKNLDYYALNFYGKRIKYKKLFQIINDVAKSFVLLGVKNGDYITFCMPTLPETVYSFYSLNSLGVVCNFIDLRMNKERIQKYINSTNSKIVISFHGVLDKVSSILKDTCASTIIDIDVTDSLPSLKKALYKIKVKDTFDNYSKDIIKWEDFLKLGGNCQLPKKIHESNVPAAIVYTGGTTGEPKGAILTNSCLNAPCYQYKFADIPRGINDRFLDIMPPFIAYGLVDGLHLPLTLGMENIIIPKFDPNEFAELLLKYRPAHFMGIPNHFEMLMSNKKISNKDLSFIINAGCGGDVVPSALEKRFNEFLNEHKNKSMMRIGYGMTENSAMSIFDLNNGMTKIGSIGIPFQKMNIGVFDEDGNECSYNEVGELYITSPEIIKEYHNNPDETRKTIIDVHGTRWIKTGDYAKIDNDGHVYIIGRKKLMFIRPDGHNVFPDLISDTILGCPLVEKVSVIGIKSKYNDNGKIPTAIVVLNDKNMDKELAKREILEFQSHCLGERDGAIDIRFRDSLPLTPIGKVDTMQLEREESTILSEINFDELTANVKKKILK